MSNVCTFLFWQPARKDWWRSLKYTNTKGTYCPDPLVLFLSSLLVGLCGGCPSPLDHTVLHTLCYSRMTSYMVSLHSFHLFLTTDLQPVLKKNEQWLALTLMATNLINQNVDQLIPGLIVHSLIQFMKLTCVTSEKKKFCIPCNHSFHSLFLLCNTYIMHVSVMFHDTNHSCWIKLSLSSLFFFL